MLSAPLGAARLREVSKTKKFAASCEQNGTTFSAAVLETSGGAGSDGDQLLRRIAANSDDPGFLRRAIQERSVTLQRGNAIILFDGMMRSQHYREYQRDLMEVSPSEIERMTAEDAAEREAVDECLQEFRRNRRSRQRGVPAQAAG